MSRAHRGSFGESLRCAWRGLADVLRNERNARVHAVAAVLVVALSAWLRLSALEWALIVVAIALVFTGEMLNTVVELVVDMITRERHPAAGRAKDVAAGAILVVSLAAALLGLLILGPRLWQRLATLGS